VKAAGSPSARHPDVPPVDDDTPLDPIEQVLVRMWIDILAGDIREALATVPTMETEVGQERGGDRGIENAADPKPRT
jgi:hypothetical protein